MSYPRCHAPGCGDDVAGSDPHDIPEKIIRRRFAGGLLNFEQDYKAAVDAWAVYDNSGEKPILLEWSEKHE